MGKEYYIQPGDNFHELAQRWGGTCEDFLLVNPGVDPMKLQVGQKIVLPEFKGASQGQGQFADIGVDRGQAFVGDYMDDVEMEVEGVRVRLRRLGEPRIPHEIHFILPRTEIRKIQHGECGPTDTQIMLSNINVVLSPRLMSDNGDRAEQGEQVVPSVEQDSPQTQVQNHQPQMTYAQSPTEPSQRSEQLQNQPRWRMSFPFK